MTQIHRGVAGLPSPEVQGLVARRMLHDEAEKAYRKLKYPYRSEADDRGFRQALGGLERHRSTPVAWAIEGIVRQGSYGALGADSKTGKTWMVIDLALSVAYGGSWLGRNKCTRGTVAVMLNEGGEAEFYDRAQAIARQKGLTEAQFQHCLAFIHIQPFASVITDPDSMARLYEELDAIQPSMIIIDSFYMSAGEADGTSLAAMGAALGNLQGIARKLDSTLMLTVHWNKGGSGTDSGRWAGTGLQQWARWRLSLSGSSTLAAEDDVTGHTTAKLTLDYDGQTSGRFGIERSVWRDNKLDLNSPMHYQVATGAAQRDEGAAADTQMDLAVLRAVSEHQEQHGTGMTERDIRRAAIGVTKVGRGAAIESLVQRGCLAKGETVAALAAGRVQEPDDEKSTKGRDTLMITTKGRGELAGGGQPVPVDLFPVP